MNEVQNVKKRGERTSLFYLVILYLCTVMCSSLKEGHLYVLFIKPKSPTVIFAQLSSQFAYLNVKIYVQNITKD